jgi:hypothetical protein
MATSQAHLVVPPALAQFGGCRSAKSSLTLRKKPGSAPVDALDRLDGAIECAGVLRDHSTLIREQQGERPGDSAPRVRDLAAPDARECFIEAIVGVLNVAFKRAPAAVNSDRVADRRARFCDRFLCGDTVTHWWRQSVLVAGSRARAAQNLAHVRDELPEVGGRAALPGEAGRQQPRRITADVC